MKIKQRSLSLLLSVVMVITFMPAMAFAAGESGERVPTGIKYKGDNYYEINGTGDDVYYFLNSFRDEGTEVDITWSDGSTEEYVVKPFEVKDKNGDITYESEYFLKSEEPHIVLNEFDNECADNYLYGLDYSIDSSGMITVIYEYEYYDEAGEEWVTLDVKDSFKGKTVKSFSYIGTPLYYEKQGNEIWADIYKEGCKVKVEFTDGSTKTASCINWGTNTDEEGYTYPIWEYIYDGEEPEVITGPDGFKYAGNSLDFFPDFENATTSKLPVTFKEIKGEFPLNEPPKPEKAEFVTASGSAVKSLIGKEFLSSEDLSGKGNKFVITYSDGTEKEYVYKNKDEGFVYKNPDGGTEEFWGLIELKKPVPKGTSTVKGTVSVWDETSGKELDITIKVKTKASKYYTFVDYKGYTYTGKKITPKVRVVYYDGKKMKSMPKNWYTAKVTKSSKIGNHGIKITFKKKYQKKYGKSIKGDYGIIPKKPTISSVKAGSGSFTAKWKAFSKAKRKNIDGFRIEFSTDKNFEKDADFYQIQNFASDAKVSDLKKGKTYYVRIYTFKLVSNGKGGRYYMLSKPSKTKKVTVK